MEPVIVCLGLIAICVTYLVLELLTTLIHELAHVLAAKAMGLRIVKVSFLFLPERFAFQFAGIDFVHTTRKGSIASVAYLAGEWWQNMIVSVCPSLVSLGMAILAGFALRQVLSPSLSLLALAIFVYFLWEFFSNMLPTEGSDGSKVLAFLREGFNRS